MSQAQLLRKLTVKDIMGVKVAAIPAVRDMIVAGGEKKNPKPVPLCQIIGRTDKAKPGVTDKGEYVRFVGEFVGINLQTGERFSAGAVILPGAAESSIYGAIGPLNDKGHAENTVEFAVEIGARYDETAATQYVYTCTPLVESKVSDPMNALLAAAGVKALAAPKPEAVKDAGGKK